MPARRIGRNSHQDPEQDATYNSGAPGFKSTSRLHPDTPDHVYCGGGGTSFPGGGPGAVDAGRGSIVNIMKSTLFRS